MKVQKQNQFRDQLDEQFYNKVYRRFRRYKQFWGQIESRFYWQLWGQSDYELHDQFHDRLERLNKFLNLLKILLYDQFRGINENTKKFII